MIDQQPNPSADPSVQRPLAGLTSLRFFAASYILLFHTRGGVWFRAGYTAVTLFFVLSGFILAYNYPHLEPRQRLRFYIARFARIYPLYLAAYFLMLPWFIPALNPQHLVWAITVNSVLYLLLLQTWFPPFHHAISAGAWTLPVEAFFYLLFPFCVARLSRLQHHFVLVLAVLCLALIAPSFIGDVVLIHIFPARASLIHDFLSIPLFHLGEFLIGIVLGLRYLHRRPLFQTPTVIAAAALCVVGLALIGPAPLRYNDITLNGSMALPFGLLIYAVAGWPSRILAHPLFQLGGEISYSMYLLQWVFVEAVQTVLHHTRAWMPLRFALFLGCCFLSYQFIEKPGRRLILRLFHINSHSKPIETPNPALP